MRQLLAYITFGLCLLAATGSYGQGIDASASLAADRTRLLVGDQARVFLSAQCDAGRGRITWPQVPDSFGRLEVVEKGKIDTVKKGALTIYTQRLLVSGWDSAEYVIPPFQFGVSPTGAAPYTIHTEGLTFQVTTVPVDTTKPFKPIKGIIPVEESWTDHVALIVLGLSLIAAIIGYIIWRKTRRKPVIAAPPPPPVPAHERALGLLQALEAEGLWQKGEVKEYYVRLTDILRNYIEERFSLPALERTTDELTAAARTHNELAFHAGKLYTILATADMAKFARAQPTPAEHISSMQATRELIMATIPPPPEAPAPDARLQTTRPS